MGSEKKQIKRKPSSTIETAVAPAGIEANKKLNPVLLNEVEGTTEKGEKSSPENEDMTEKPTSKAEGPLGKDKNNFGEGNEETCNNAD